MHEGGGKVVDTYMKVENKVVDTHMKVEDKVVDTCIHEGGG